MYLNINKKIFSKYEKQAKAQALKEMDEPADGQTDDRVFMNLEECDMEVSQLEDGIINIAGDFKTESGELLGYVGIEIPIGLELAADITQYYIKKLNKVKTMLESTK